MASSQSWNFVRAHRIAGVIGVWHWGRPSSSGHSSAAHEFLQLKPALRPMPPDLDIYRSAKLLIDQHGEDVPIFAAQQADRCLEAGDLDGKAVWMRVIAAIEELQDQRPPTAGQPVH